MSNAPITTAERYAVATHSSDLTETAERRTDVVVGAMVADVRCKALQDAARWVDEEMGHAIQDGWSVEAVQALMATRDMLRAHADMLATADQMLAVDLCGNCTTEDACYLRGQCAHRTRAASLRYRATPLHTPTGKPNGHWHVESELGHPVCDVRDEETARLFAEALNRRGATGGVAAPPAPYRPGEK